MNPNHPPKVIDLNPEDSDMATPTNPTGLYDRIGGQKGLTILLKHFYSDVRQHRVLGPIFNKHIQDWPAHLAHIGEFWARATGGPSHFQGSLPTKHAPLQLEVRHFEAWLGLWEANCKCYLGRMESDEMIRLAQGVARRLML